MKNLTISVSVILVIISLNSHIVSAQSENSNQNKNHNNMKSFISIFEIPATDINRAVSFYQSILGINIEVIDMQGMQMGLFPSEGHAVSGVITSGEGYEPSTNGVLVYLNGGDNLELVLNKIEQFGGQIVMPKSLIDEENGYFAMFIDSEGNKMGLHSPN